MLFLLLHMFAGLLTGMLFRVQILVTFALLVVIETVWGAVANASASFLLWGLGAEAMLQFGYLAGACGRDILEQRISPFALR